DRGADEAEPSSLQLAAHRFGLGGRCRQVTQMAAAIGDRPAAGERPDEAIETAALLLHGEKSAGVVDRPRPLETVADQTRVAQQTLQIGAVIACDALGIETIHGAAVTHALVEDGRPA